MTPRIVTVVQARTGSTRMPGKVMAPLLGEPALLRQLERIRRAKLAGTIVVATTLELEDDVIQSRCLDRGYAVYRGHPTDLLDRHVKAAWAFGADHVVKIPSDCPLIDSRVVDRVLGFYLAHLGEFDYVSNLHPPTHPDGNDVEVMPVSILETAWREATTLAQREHTTPFIWDQPRRFRLGNVTWEKGLDYSMSHRFTLDYPEDYDFIAAVYERLYPRKPAFSLTDVLDLLENEPELGSINARHAGVNWYRHHLAELHTIHPSMTRSPEVA
jgi:spore coat polysaccharide biosynthesis protein SpsF